MLRKSDLWVSRYHGEARFTPPREQPSQASRLNPAAGAIKFPSLNYRDCKSPGRLFFNEHDAGFIEAVFYGFLFRCVWSWQAVAAGLAGRLILRGSYLKLGSALGIQRFTCAEFPVAFLQSGLIANIL